MGGIKGWRKGNTLDAMAQREERGVWTTFEVKYRREKGENTTLKKALHLLAERLLSNGLGLRCSLSNDGNERSLSGNLDEVLFTVDTR